MVVVVLASLEAVGQARSNSGVESKIIALERLEKLQAFSGKDLKTLDSLLDEQFVDVDQQGTARARTEFMAYVQSNAWMGYTMSDLVVRVHGDTAIITGLYKVGGLQRGRSLVRRGRFVDTWLNKDGHWIEIASVSTPVD